MSEHVQHHDYVCTHAGFTSEIGYPFTPLLQPVENKSMILAGDIGGTKARIAFYAEQDGSFVRGKTETFTSRDFSSLEAVLTEFLRKHNQPVSAACFGVPGPVVNGAAEITNLPWQPKETRIAQALDLPAVKLVNDLVATTAAIPYFAPRDLLTIYAGDSNPRGDTYAVLAPGTGLGQGFLNSNPDHFHVLASEGGHADFAPTNDLEIELLQYLRIKFDRVSYERVLSGKGLVNIYDFLKDTGKQTEPANLNERLATGDPAAVISSAGQAGEFDICVQALDIFASILGSQAGNLVLTLMATGGIYLGGGIPPKLCKKLIDGTLVAAYLNKGRLTDLLERTPVYVIRDDHAALLGAAYFAAKLSKERQHKLAR